MLFQSCFPYGGTQPIFTAKKNINMMPNQKGGADCPIRATNFPNASIMVPRFTADKMPNGTPINNEKVKATAPNSSVAGARSITTSVTGRPSLTDSPKSPRKAPFRKMPYCW